MGNHVSGKCIKSTLFVPGVETPVPYEVVTADSLPEDGKAKRITFRFWLPNTHRFWVANTGTPRVFHLSLRVEDLESVQADLQLLFNGASHGRKMDIELPFVALYGEHSVRIRLQREPASTALLFQLTSDTIDLPQKTFVSARPTQTDIIKHIASVAPALAKREGVHAVILTTYTPVCTPSVEPHSPVTDSTSTGLTSTGLTSTGLTSTGSTSTGLTEVSPSIGVTVVPTDGEAVAPTAEATAVAPAEAPAEVRTAVQTPESTEPAPPTPQGIDGPQFLDNRGPWPTQEAHDGSEDGMTLPDLRVTRP